LKSYERVFGFLEAKSSVENKDAAIPHDHDDVAHRIGVGEEDVLIVRLSSGSETP
jgi:hypothetical protein